MKAALISLGSVSSRWTLTAMRRYFDIVDDINLKNVEVYLSNNPEVLYEGKPLEKYDCILAKGSFRFEQVLRSVTSLLYKTTYMPLKPAAFTLGHDKLLTHLALQQHRIPMPTTYIAATTEAAVKILKKVNYPIVMKFPHGTQGKGVMFADSFASASSLLDALTALRQPFIIQEYIETGGVDIRAIVVGEKVVASMKRKAELGEKRANIHAGGKGEVCQLDYHTSKLAVEAAKAIGAEICAVDILESARGYLVIELNVSPGLQGITKATGIDVADKIAKHMFERTKSIMDSDNKTEARGIMSEISIDLEKQIITTLDMRGGRILLPELLTKITKFSDNNEVTIKARNGKLTIEKFSVGK